MADYSRNSAGPSLKQPVELMHRTLTGNSQYSQRSVAKSTRSWVQSNQQNTPGALPPLAQPVDHPIKPPRPLPNPHPQAAIHRPLHVVNVPDIDHGKERNEEHMNTKIDHRMEFGYRSEGFEKGNTAETNSAGFARPRKKKSFVGGFVKRFRRLPKSMFGYGAGMGGFDSERLQRSGTLVTETTSTSISGNTLPVYTSKPSTPIATSGRPGIHGQYHIPGGVIMSEPTEPPIPESPPPDVVRLSSHRASVPLDNFANEENARVDDGHNRFSRQPNSESSSGNQMDRTTVMLYHDQSSKYYEGDQAVPRPTPSAISRQPSSGPGALSYVADPLQPVRSSSTHSSHTVLPPLEIPKRVPTPGPNGPRVSYASPAPPPHRTIPQSLIPGSRPSTAPPTQYEVQTVPPCSDLQSHPAPLQPVEDIQSPVTAHPGHTADYLRMTLSPPPTSHNTFATGSSYYDPPFSSQLNPVERFFMTLYHMPWVSHGRVTVDYLPGAGVSVRKKRKLRPVASWYRSFLSRSSKNSETIDASSNTTGIATGVETSPRANLRASLAMILGSPISGRSSNQYRRKRHRSQDGSKDSHHRHHHSSRRHHHHPRHTNKKTRPTSTDTADTGTTNKGTESSPLIPSVYPYQYPTYPYPAFPSFPLPVPAPIIEEEPSETKSKGKERPASPRGPRAFQQPSPMFYTPGAGYASYQPMAVPPPQVFLLQSPTSFMYGNTPVPTALVPGGGHQNTHAHDAHSGGGRKVQPQDQPVVAGSGAVVGQNIPGSFSSSVI